MSEYKNEPRNKQVIETCFAKMGNIFHSKSYRLHKLNYQKMCPTVFFELCHLECTVLAVPNLLHA